MYVDLKEKFIKCIIILEDAIISGLGLGFIYE